MYQATYTFDLPCSAQVHVHFGCHVDYVPASGDGWNEPREPAHYEITDYRPYAVEFDHLDGQTTAVKFQQGSILYRYFEALLESLPIEDLEECLDFEPSC